jgi:hypothetical protein
MTKELTKPPGAGFPGLGLACAAVAALLGALAVGERAGLPGTLAWPLGFVLLLAATLAVVAAVRTAVERDFLGRAVLSPPLGGGLLLGAVTAGAAFHLLRPAGSADLVSAGLGAIAGLCVAHVVARFRRGASLLLGEAGRGEDGAPSLIQGLLTAGVGLLLALAAFPPARDAVMLLTGWGGVAASLVVAAPPVVAIAAGGVRGLLALAAALALVLAAGLGLTLALGLARLGTLPLPGFLQEDVLLAIAGVRTRLLQADSLPFVVSWLPPGGVAGLVFSLPFLAAAAMAGLVGRALSPAIPIASGVTLAAAAAGQAAVLLGLAAMAGYAVEAAGLQYVGASLQAPPAGLLEASRQGLAEFCGARPATLDALRAACGLALRAQGQLDLSQIRILEPFLWTGVPVALGAPAALAAPARLGPAAFPSLAVVVGVWLMAQGLGRGVFGRGRIAPGLASHRLGLVRLSAVISAAALAAAVAAGAAPAQLWQPAALLALMALGLDLIQQGLRPAPEPQTTEIAVQRAATSRMSAAPRTTAHSA